jgi:hypothetical protein
VYGCLGNEESRKRHVDIRAVEIEGIARRDDEADDGALAARFFHLRHQARQRCFRRGGAQNKQQFFLDVADQGEDREAVVTGNSTEDHENEDRRQVERADQHGEIGDRADAILADGEGHGAECTDRGSLHQDGDQLEHRRCQSVAGS